MQTQTPTKDNTMASDLPRYEMIIPDAHFGSTHAVIRRHPETPYGDAFKMDSDEDLKLLQDLLKVINRDLGDEKAPADTRTLERMNSMISRHMSHCMACGYLYLDPLADYWRYAGDPAL